jgi:hypothetical protein
MIEAIRRMTHQRPRSADSGCRRRRRQVPARGALADLVERDGESDLVGRDDIWQRSD